MTRRAAIDSISQAMFSFGAPIGAPLDGGGDRPGLQRALDTANHIAYRTRTFVMTEGAVRTITVPAVSAARVVVLRWRMHTPDLLNEYALLVYCRRSVGGNGTISLARDGTVVARVTPIDAASGFKTRSDLTGAVGAAGDHTWEIVVDRQITPVGTVTIGGIWVAFSDVPIP